MSSALEQGTARDASHLFRRQLRRLAFATALLLLAFGLPLLRLAGFVAHSELFSYIPLVPLISGYLVWMDRRRHQDTLRAALERGELRPCWPAAILLCVLGATLVAGYWAWRLRRGTLRLEDDLACLNCAEVLFFWALCFLFLGRKMVWQIAFPLGFLILAAPLPTAVLKAIDLFFQFTSATMAACFCGWIGTPVLCDGTVLHLPGQSLQVGPECSGIHSTWVLLMTGLLAGYLFLKRYWSRAALLLAVVPLAILRNGFRVFVIGELCVHFGPRMIDSPIHRQGGPLFFALTLAPFFFLLLWLRKLEAPPATPCPK